ncbi:Major phosphate-irrepressible acid phosphatase precursor [compost metagenome]
MFLKNSLFLSFMLFSTLANADVASVIANFPPPPVEGSEIDIADIAKVREYQTTRTEEDCKRTRHEQYLDIQSTFAEPYGPLTKEEASKLSPLYSKIFVLTDEYVIGIKELHKRPRPFVRDEKIVLCVPSHPSTSYPSGHATISRTAANIFATLLPAKAAALKARADQMAEDRVLGGVHHPSDIEAGKTLADIVSEELLKQQVLRIPLENAKKSLSNPL